MGNRLISYRGQDITYDEIGNPLSYYNGQSYTFSWQNGRELAFAHKGTDIISYEYNDQGIRISKTVNGTKHTYQLDGSRIISESWGDEILIYLYDAEGSPVGMQSRYAGYSEGKCDTFWFEKNLQGDIVAIIS